MKLRLLAYTVAVKFICKVSIVHNQKILREHDLL